MKAPHWAFVTVAKNKDVLLWTLCVLWLAFVLPVLTWQALAQVFTHLSFWSVLVWYWLSYALSVTVRVIHNILIQARSK